MTDDLVSRLLAAIQEREDKAKAAELLAGGSVWYVSDQGDGDVRTEGGGYVACRPWRSPGWTRLAVIAAIRAWLRAGIRRPAHGY